MNILDLFIRSGMMTTSPLNFAKCAMELMKVSYIINKFCGLHNCASNKEDRKRHTQHIYINFNISLHYFFTGFLKSDLYVGEWILVNYKQVSSFALFVPSSWQLFFPHIALTNKRPIWYRISATVTNEKPVQIHNSRQQFATNAVLDIFSSLIYLVTCWSCSQENW